VNGWQVELTPSARRELRHLEDGPRQAALELIADLAEDPALVPAIELDANPNNWRARFHHDRCRMVYQISSSRKHILVTRIRPRPTAYESMKR
jgi:mRNA-degrading endonuclease RelE of RelBE toxin-antitoxin system